MIILRTLKISTFENDSLVNFENLNYGHLNFENLVILKSSKHDFKKIGSVENLENEVLEV